MKLKCHFEFGEVRKLTEEELIAYQEETAREEAEEAAAEAAEEAEEAAAAEKAGE